LDGSGRGKLIAYVQKRYNVPASVPIEVTQVGFVDGSCYRKLDFHARKGGGPLHVTLYASPDLRFLSHDLMDSGTGPAQQRVRNSAGASPALSRGNPAIMGQKDAPVTIVLFSDFQCPYCARMAEGLNNEILPAEKGKVRILFRNFPLPMHSWARSASEAAECARQQGEQYFWKFHDYLFQHQRELKPEALQADLLAYAKGLPGIQVWKLKACMDGRATASAVDQDIALGKEAGVTGTPTLLVGDERLSGYQPEQIRALIQRVSGGKQTGRGLACSRTDTAEKERSKPPVSLATLARGNPVAIGQKDAPVTMTLFSDFQCPYCARMAEGLTNEILPAEKERVRLLFRNFPLSMHAWARSAAEAAACARQQGERYFWNFHNHLFQRQRELKPETLREDLLAYAKGLPGFRAGKFKACLDAKSESAAVEQDLALGREIGVTGTPTLFVGGERIVGYQPERIRELIQQAGKATESRQ
jgi:protein-disulfide isomerase